MIGDLKAGSLVRYQYCVDKDGVGTIGYIIVVYQFEELPPGMNRQGRHLPLPAR